MRVLMHVGPIKCEKYSLKGEIWVENSKFAILYQITSFNCYMLILTVICLTASLTAICSQCLWTGMGVLKTIGSRHTPECMWL